MKKISINIKGHSTSFSIEEEFLNVLKQICKKEKKSLNQVIYEIDTDRGDYNLSSAIRVFILKKYLE